jgi:hypothetical protein
MSAPNKDPNCQRQAQTLLTATIAKTAFPQTEQQSQPTVTLELRLQALLHYTKAT